MPPSITTTGTELLMDPALTYATSKWFLLVQGGAVVLSIVLGWVIYRMSMVIGTKDEALARVYEDRITQQREDADTEKESTRLMVEAMTKNTEALEGMRKSQEAVERRLENLERKRNTMEG